MSSTEAKLLELSNIYNSILITELARHLKLSNEEAEKLVVSLVWKKELKATIDQVEGIVFFEGHEEIDEWEGKIEKIINHNIRNS
ncbi:COP9 signalosome complex subunit 4 [Entamoeba marina]